MVALVLLVLLIALGVASLLGHTTDTRDAAYGRVIAFADLNRAVVPAGNLPGNAGPRSSVDRAVAF
jgi:hypothetical protein